MLTKTLTTTGAASPAKNFPNETLPVIEIIRFCGFPIGVSADPMLALVARAMRYGWGGRPRARQRLRMNDVRMTQVVSFVRRAAEMAEKMQSRQRRSAPPKLRHASNQLHLELEDG
jgi:hypothetical protein